jgi:hypothetical protein
LSKGVWCLIANPSDLPRFDDIGMWRDLAECLQPLVDRGAIVLEHSTSASEVCLRTAAAQGWPVLHFIGHARARDACYSTLALLSADGRARNLTAFAFANVIAKSAFRLVVLEVCKGSDFGCDTLAGLMGERPLTMILVPSMGRDRRRKLLAALYTGLVDGVSVESLARSLADLTDGAARVVEHVGQRPIEGQRPAPVASAVEKAVGLGPELTPAQVAYAHPARAVNLEQKRSEGCFDVFLCYHSADGSAVKSIAERLRKAGVLPWLDVWELPPGRDWQALVEEQISKVQSAAIFFGASGRGPWQNREVRVLLEQFVEAQTPIIPVLLPGAPLKPDLPLFLRSLTWVDFRCEDPDPFFQLLWGITGKRPEN